MSRELLYASLIVVRSNMPKQPNKVRSAPNNPQRADSLSPAVSEDGPANPTKEPSNSNRPYPKWAWIRDIVFALGAFAAVSLLVWQAAHWLQDQVDKKVAEKLDDDKILRQIAAHVKPSIIFNAKESIISDMGAAQFVKTVRVIKRNPDGAPKRIEIDFTRHFASAPILTALYDSVAIYPERGKGLAWEFEIQWIIAEGERDDAKNVYRLELIP